jgi:peptide deformylase
MAILEILQYPDPRLRIKAKPVTVIDKELKRIIADMNETMYATQGVGVAATQVNIHQHLFVMDTSETRDQPECIFNAEIISKEGTQDDFHGCLSVGASISDKIQRAAKIKVRSMDIDGKIIEWEAEGLKAICVQHEIDHLNGILYIDHFSRLKQERIRKKIEKNKARG